MPTFTKKNRGIHDNFCVSWSQGKKKASRQAFIVGKIKKSKVAVAESLKSSSV